MSRYFNGTGILKVDVTGLTFEVKPVTISFWFMCDAEVGPPTGGVPIFFGKTNGTGWNARYASIEATKATSILVANNFASYTTADAVTPINVGVWYHCVMTVDAPGAAPVNQCFINGTITSGANTTAVTAFTEAVTHLVIGGSFALSSFETPFLGLIADVGLWDVLLNTTEIAELGTNVKRPGDVRTANLRGWWKLEGTTAPEPNAFGDLAAADIVGSVIGGTDPPYAGGASMPAAGGAFSFTGQDIIGVYGKGLAVSHGGYAFAGQDVAFQLTVMQRLDALVGAFSLMGKNVMMHKSGFSTPTARIYIVRPDPDITD